jgi:poly(hydroxyalkanoate) depolymerase family esterase
MKWIVIWALTLGFFKAHASLVYAPKTLNPASADIVVVIHGCLQSAEAMSLGTRFNRMADQNNWLVLYPQVPKGNPIDCWSWYLPENQTPKGGELKLVHDEIEEVRARFRIRGNVFLSGISSGGATVTGLMACYPDAYKAVGIHSAPAYGLAQTVEEAKVVMEHGPSFANPAPTPCKLADFQGRALIIHGKDDRVVHPQHADYILQTLIYGKPTVSRLTTATAKGLRYDDSQYFLGGTLYAEMIKVEGLGHAWSGSAPTSLSYFDTRGPDATQMFSDFFKLSKQPGRAVRAAP